MLKNLRCQRYDFHVHCTEFTRNRAEDTAATQFTGIVQQYASIIVETDIRTVSTANLLFRTDNQSLRHCTFFHITRRNGVLDSHDDDVAYASIAATCTTQHTNAKALTGTAIVSYCKS